MSEELDKPITLPDREPDEVTVEDDEGVRRTVRLWREPGGVEYSETTEARIPWQEAAEKLVEVEQMNAHAIPDGDGTARIAPGARDRCGAHLSANAVTP